MTVTFFEAALPAASRAVTRRVVCPDREQRGGVRRQRRGRDEIERRDAGEVGRDAGLLLAIPFASVAVKLTFGALIEGAFVSCTDDGERERADVARQPSVAVQVTVVVPSGKTVPLEGAQVIADGKQRDAVVRPRDREVDLRPAGAVGLDDLVERADGAELGPAPSIVKVDVTAAEVLPASVARSDGEGMGACGKGARRGKGRGAGRGGARRIERAHEARGAGRAEAEVGVVSVIVPVGPLTVGTGGGVVSCTVTVKLPVTGSMPGWPLRSGAVHRRLPEREEVRRARVAARRECAELIRCGRAEGDRGSLVGHDDVGRQRQRRRPHTVTVKEPDASGFPRPSPSSAVQVTVVTPRANVEPEAGLQLGSRPACRRRRL